MACRLSELGLYSVAAAFQELNEQSRAGGLEHGDGLIVLLRTKNYNAPPEALRGLREGCQAAS
ncbi:hypothetical protein HFN46_25390 [Rhizobium leguminosarum]|nr:hypothetical protein [Rhizobium leguminosarum]